jgi:hypothetical protein
MFYKQGEKEEMACQGLRAVEALMARQQISRENLRLGPKERQLWTTYRQTLTDYVCCRCPFQAEDCDFQSPFFADGMEPCGGVIVLSLLLKNNLLNPPMLESLS